MTGANHAACMHTVSLPMFPSMAILFTDPAVAAVHSLLARGAASSAIAQFCSVQMKATWVSKVKVECPHPYRTAYPTAFYTLIFYAHFWHMHNQVSFSLYKEEITTQSLIRATRNVQTSLHLLSSLWRNTRSNQTKHTQTQTNLSMACCLSDPTSCSRLRHTLSIS